MNISPPEAEEALAAIQGMVMKTRRAISSSGAYQFLIAWGVIWLLGFTGSQFLASETSGIVWTVLDILGGIVSTILGIRMSRMVRSASPSSSGKRIGLFWLLLMLYCVAALAVSWTADWKQVSVYIILFVMTGWLAMGLLLSVVSVWPSVLITALVLIGYFLLPGIFYLWVAVLGGGGMIALGLYIRARW